MKKLLGNVDNPEEKEIESLCKLLTTVGNSLDTQKARAHMDVYFSQMKELTKSPHVTPHMQFMLQVCEFHYFQCASLTIFNRMLLNSVNVNGFLGKHTVFPLCPLSPRFTKW